jgi:hypothetical protein
MSPKKPNSLNSKFGHIFLNSNGNLYNFGSRIKYVKMFDKIDHSGFVIKYSDGDFCNLENSTRYETYLFLNCDKSNNLKAPRLIGFESKYN